MIYCSRLYVVRSGAYWSPAGQGRLFRLLANQRVHTAWLPSSFAIRGFAAGVRSVRARLVSSPSPVRSASASSRFFCFEEQGFDVDIAVPERSAVPAVRWVRVGVLWVPDGVISKVVSFVIHGNVIP